MGIAVKLSTRQFVFMTRNQVGVFLMDYILSITDLSGKKPTVVKTVVTFELGAEIAQKHGITVFDTLTGFKFIGEKITQFEKVKVEGKTLGDKIEGIYAEYGYYQDVLDSFTLKGKIDRCDDG